MRATAKFRLPDGSTSELGAGDLIGRLASAALLLDDPRVSEAHALVSMRRGDLCLLALRRLVGIKGKGVSDVVLEPGLVIELADDLSLLVERVTKPDRVRALRARDFGVRPLAQIASVVEGPPLRLVSRFVPGAAAHLWSSGEDEWRLRIGDARVRPIGVGDTFTAAGCSFEMCAVDLDATDHDTTQGVGIHAPLRIVAHYDSVEIHRQNRPPVMFGGMGARLISEVVACGGPVGWDVVARELWKDEVDGEELRHRWDVLLGRVRARMREAGLRSDLLRSDRAGQLQLMLYEGDRVDDRT